MKSKKRNHKFGYDRNEEALKARKPKKNFSTSKDIHEDRSTMQRRVSGKR